MTTAELSADGTVVVEDSAQSGVYGGTPVRPGSNDARGHTVADWFSSVDRFLVIHLDVVCV